MNSEASTTEAKYNIRARFKVSQNGFELDVDLTLPSQGVTAIFGPSGSGKTTLLRSIAGLEKHAGGVMQLAELTWQDGDIFVPTHMRSIGYVFQEASLFTHLNVQANLAYGRKRRTIPEHRDALQDAVHLLGIAHLLERMPNTLSGGERQRVAIARALASGPKILLMDEPLASLDHARKREIMPFLEALHKNLKIPILYVSHSIDEVMRLADHLVLIDNGNVIASGPSNEVLTQLDLPLVSNDDAASLIETTLVEHDARYHLSYLEFAGVRISVPLLDEPLGSNIRIRLAARDVSLTLQHQRETSILNIFPAIVDQIQEADGAQQMVRLLAADVPILARVTVKSLALLNLKLGAQVFVQAKSVAILS